VTISKLEFLIELDRCGGPNFCEPAYKKNIGRLERELRTRPASVTSDWSQVLVHPRGTNSAKEDRDRLTQPAPS
jgi:hypothetical protein